MTVLVGYATYHGSTRGVAERVAERLEGQGLPVDVLAVDDVDDVSAYEAVVVGSAIHNAKWLPEGTAFVGNHVEALRRRPVWMFSVGSMGDGSTSFSPWVTAMFRKMMERRGSTAETPATARLHDLVHARGHRAFAGVIAREDWPLLGQVIFRLMGGHFGDYRDWDDIDTWADEVGVAIRAEDGTARLTRLRHLRAA